MLADATSTQPQRPAAANTASALMLAVSTLWCLYWFVHARGYWEDDAYIHLEFARSVAAGQGFAFNGHVVSGDTSPLWVLLLAAAHAIIPNWMIAGKALTVAGAIFALSGISAFARNLASKLLPPPPIASVFPTAMVLLVVANPYSCYWLFSGMESITAAGLACFAVVAATRDRPTTKSFLIACFFAGIAPILRPEMIFLTALLALPLLEQSRRLRASPLTFVAGLILLIAPLALWSMYSLHAFGHMLPNTNAAKRAMPGDSVLLRLAMTYSLGFPIIVCGLLAGIAILAFRSNKSTPHNSSNLPFACWIFILWPSIAAIFYIVNHTYVQTRYILVSAPGLMIVILALILRSFPLAGRVLYLAALVSAFGVSVVTVRPFLHNKTISCQVNRDLALFIHDRIPPDAPVATYSIGEIAFLSQHPIVDTGGITRPGAIPYLNAPLTEMTRWARSQGAQYYISSPQPEPGAVPVYTANPPYVGWTFDTALYGIRGEFYLWKLATESPQAAADSPAAYP
jgi:hypothetical protein